MSLSVVIASGAGGDFLPRCLASLREQAAAESAEVIVVDRCGGDTRERIVRDFPFVTLVGADLDHRPSVPELRKLGALRARGDVVAILEEHCVVPPEWLRTIRAAFDADDVVIGGPILDNDFDRIRDWVVYFSEYHNYLPPWPDGPRINLNGANIAYRRDALLRHAEVLASGFWETVLHPQLMAEGASFRAVAQMGVYHTGPFDYVYYLHQRYLLSRSWSGARRAHTPLTRRLLYLVGAPLFPFLLLARIAHRVVSSGAHVGKLFLALPLLLPVTVVYVYGEWLGYLSGPGHALDWVE